MMFNKVYTFVIIVSMFWIHNKSLKASYVCEKVFSKCHDIEKVGSQQVGLGCKPHNKCDGTCTPVEIERCSPESCEPLCAYQDCVLVLTSIDFVPTYKGF